jgi:hypothetical protein
MGIVGPHWGPIRFGLELAARRMRRPESALPGGVRLAPVANRLD